MLGYRVPTGRAKFSSDGGYVNMNKQAIIRFVVAAVMIWALTVGVDVVMDALGFAPSNIVQAAMGGASSGGGCC